MEPVEKLTVHGDMLGADAFRTVKMIIGRK